MVHGIPHSQCITGTLPSDCLASYTWYSLEESYLSAEMQSVYSTAPADYAYLLIGDTVFLEFLDITF